MIRSCSNNNQALVFRHSSRGRGQSLSGRSPKSARAAETHAVRAQHSSQVNPVSVLGVFPEPIAGAADAAGALGVAARQDGVQRSQCRASRAPEAAPSLVGPPVCTAAPAHLVGSAGRCGGRSPKISCPPSLIVRAPRRESPLPGQAACHNSVSATHNPWTGL